MDANLEIAALKQGLGKNDMIVAALREYLKSLGLQPDKQPHISKVEY